MNRAEEVKRVAANVAETERLSRRMAKLLYGKPPELQGAVLGNLVSLFIAGHHPELRMHAFLAFIRLIRDLVPESEKEIFGGRAPPDEWWTKH